MQKEKRRTILKKLIITATGIAGIPELTAANPDSGISPAEKEYQDIPLFSPVTKSGDLLFLSGKVSAVPGDIATETKNILDKMEDELTKAGSSMKKVLKVTVYLKSMDDFAGMNAIYRGRFGATPPVRTTVGVSELVGTAKIEIDCIATV